VLPGIHSEYWQTDTSISNKSWGYIQDDIFKTPDLIVHELIDIVSKNGNLLLNVGPRSDGTIPEEVQKILQDVGSWLGANGEAIYGTRPWSTYGEGPTKVAEGPMRDVKTEPYTAQDFRFTSKSKEKTVYAIEMAWPSTGKTVIRSFGMNAFGKGVDSIELLSSGSKLKFQQEADGLHIDLPTRAPGKYAYVFRVRLQE
jgi:alpha-L-fucosidase